ncbi:MAG TPA: ADP-ribosylation factor-like protein [Anaerolineaceae bacterium]|nr:ADP-ribosylation factor-like protein [Anaerolineaceae bacterium]HPN52154.1 ADP-ribosylation factor-like protein [Anaerolineaceae bacterium]
MQINWRLRELTLKIVYYGPAMSGKTTNLEQIHSHVDPLKRSELLSLKTAGDRTLFFDFLQLELGRIGTLTPKIQLYTVPGQTYYESCRKVVLKGADGVVFVVDSDVNRWGSNLESWKNLFKHLQSLRIPLERTPIIVQFNKQDLPNAMSPEQLKKLLNLGNNAVVSAAAIRGEGVLDTFKLVTRNVMAQAQREMA